MQIKNHVFLSSVLGSFICWYDFIIFGMATAMVFGKVFFPGLSFVIPMMVFAVGFFARPLGAVVFGHFGDRYGRKPVLLATLTLTALSTVLIGLLPTPDAIGIAAPILLVVLRILQTAAFGGEWAATSTIMLEYNQDTKLKNFWGSFLAAGLPLASIVAGLMFVLVTSRGNEVFLDWGWRIPFLLSAVLVAVGLYARAKLPETPIFNSMPKTESVPLRTVVRDHWKKVLLALGVHQVGTLWNYLVSVFGVAYLVNQMGVARGDISQTMMWVSAIGIFVLVFYGWLSDKIGGLKMYQLCAGIGLLFIVPVLYWISVGNVLLPILFGYLLISKLSWAQAPTFLTEIFPPEVRQTGSGLVMNLSGVIGGGLVPVAAQYMIEVGGSIMHVAWVLIAMSIVSLVSSVYLKRLLNK